MKTLLLLILAWNLPLIADHSVRSRHTTDSELYPIENSEQRAALTASLDSKILWKRFTEEFEMTNRHLDRVIEMIKSHPLSDTSVQAALLMAKRRLILEKPILNRPASRQRIVDMLSEMARYEALIQYGLHNASLMRSYDSKMMSDEQRKAINLEAIDLFIANDGLKKLHNSILFPKEHELNYLKASQHGLNYRNDVRNVVRSEGVAPRNQRGKWLFLIQKWSMEIEKELEQYRDESRRRLNELRPAGLN